VLKVHPSNYRIGGFTEETNIAELAGVTGSVPLLYDLGSGLLDSAAAWLPEWLGTEPAARQSLEAGADLVMFSGDKLLGGPQAGIILGSKDMIGHVRDNPLTRALRVDAVTYAAMTATLEAYVSGTPEEIPFWRSALMAPDDLEGRALKVAAAVRGDVFEGVSRVGAGSAPDVEIPGPLIRLPGDGNLFDRLLQGDHPLLARRLEGDLIIDLRCVDPDDDERVVEAIEACR
jgi:L-seryl-tRNA(Ser) seleniumtransferase